MGYAIGNDLLDIPKHTKINNSYRVLPRVFVGDDAFGLKTTMMKQFPFQDLEEDK